MPTPTLTIKLNLNDLYMHGGEKKGFDMGG